jgi:GH25 family lysozyme M1 (1,4-beta-N-acetylmuramidase)
VSAQGQDRSNWQGVGPWTGLGFGFCKATEATGYVDPTFASNWANMRVEGVPRGAYHFFHPAVSAVEQAQFFVGRVHDEGLQDGDMLVSDTEITVGTDGKLRMSPHAAHRSALFDVDADSVLIPLATGYESSIPATMDASAFPGTVRTFLDTVHELAPHSPVLIYTNRSVGSQLANCSGYLLWIAWPEDTPPPSVAPWDSWKFWQWAWSGGWDNCDRDAYNGTEAELRDWLARYKPANPTPAPKPAPAVHLMEEDVPVLNTGIGAVTPVSVQSGGAKGIQFTNDCNGAGDPPPMLRVAIYSKAHAWSQIEGEHEGTFVLKPSAPTEVTFTADDVEALSISRYAQGAQVPVGYSLLT